jgi:hypothetical protein
MTNEKYLGKILKGNYSKKLKNRVSEYIQNLQAFEKTGVPIINYLAAWEDEKKSIWYEFASRKFLNIMGCEPSEIDGVFRNSVVDRRVYKYLSEDEHIEKDAINKSQISFSREKLRNESEKEGNTEAVYKILPDQGRAVWLKDIAKIEIHKDDNICLSLGFMTDITKEMTVFEEKERLAEKLQKSLDRLKTK